MNFCKKHPSVPEQYFYKGICTRCMQMDILEKSGPLAWACFLYSVRQDEDDPRDFESRVLWRYELVLECNPPKASKDELYRRLNELL